MSSILSRRQLVAGAVSFPLSSNVIAENNSPDVELIGLCAQYRKLMAALDCIVEMPRGSDPGYLLVNRVLDAMVPVDAAIMSIPARTIEGLKAKAAIAGRSRQGFLDVDNDAGLDERMVWSIVRDLLNS